MYTCSLARHDIDHNKQDQVSNACPQICRGDTYLNASTKQTDCNECMPLPDSVRPCGTFHAVYRTCRPKDTIGKVELDLEGCVSKMN